MYPQEGTSHLVMGRGVVFLGRQQQIVGNSITIYHNILYISYFILCNHKIQLVSTPTYAQESNIYWAIKKTSMYSKI